jgi:hypothetical protein
MGITNQIPSSRLIQPGVCTSTTRPASPYEGQAIFETDTDRMLIYNGTAWVIPNSPAQNPMGLELVKTCTVTSAGGTAATASDGVITIGGANTSVTVSNAFSALYDNYLVQISSTVVSANQPNLGIRVGATNSNYNYAGNYNSYSSATVTGDVNSTATFFVIGACGNGTAGAGRVSMDCEVRNPFLDVATFFHASNGSLAWSSTYNGMINNSTVYSAFTILPSSGTLTGGTIRVYGYRNS